MKYITNDGKIFENIAEAKDWEKELASREEEQKKKDQEKIAAKKKLDDAYEAYKEAYIDYNEKYGTTVSSLSDLFECFFN